MSSGSSCTAESEKEPSTRQGHNTTSATRTEGMNEPDAIPNFEEAYPEDGTDCLITGKLRELANDHEEEMDDEARELLHALFETIRDGARPEWFEARNTY